MPRVTVLAPVCWLLLAGSAVAQLQGEFYLDKNKFIVGEPVYLHFKIANIGKTTLQIETAYLYSGCAGYLIRVSDGRPFPAHPSDGCYRRAFGSSCGIGHGPLGPGESKTEDILLNYEHNLGNPGTYYITASRDLPYGTADEILPPNAPKFETTAHLKMTIGSGDEATLRAILQPYVGDLTSRDDNRNSEAHIVIGSVAPPFLEGTILEMLNSDSSRGFAVLALHKMNTARSRRALADVAAKAGEWQGQAIQELGEMGDRTYYPLLLSIASNSKSAANVVPAATIAAAELGGDEALPLLLKLLHSPTQSDRILADQAMDVSASRKAVPVLIELLRDHDNWIAGMAAGTLATLTHREPPNPSDHYPEWVLWWSLHADTAPIFGPKDCGEIEPLPQAKH